MLLNPSCELQKKMPNQMGSGAVLSGRPRDQPLRRGGEKATKYLLPWISSCQVLCSESECARGALLQKGTVKTGSCNSRDRKGVHRSLTISTNATGTCLKLEEMRQLCGDAGQLLLSSWRRAFKLPLWWTTMKGGGGRPAVMSLMTLLMIFYGSIVFLSTSASGAQQISSDTTQNHFLEAELPVLEVVGVEGEEVGIPCDVTPPSSRDTPILILIGRGKLPLYSVDARSGSSTSSTHWINREVLGDRAQFRFPPQYSSFSVSKHSLTYEHNNPLFTTKRATNAIGSIDGYIESTQNFNKEQHSQVRDFNEMLDKRMESSVADKEELMFSDQPSRIKLRKSIRHSKTADDNIHYDKFTLNKTQVPESNLLVVKDNNVSKSIEDGQDQSTKGQNKYVGDKSQGKLNIIVNRNYSVFKYNSIFNNSFQYNSKLSDGEYYFLPYDTFPNKMNTDSSKLHEKLKWNKGPAKRRYGSPLLFDAIYMHESNSSQISLGNYIWQHTLHPFASNTTPESLKISNTKSLTPRTNSRVGNQKNFLNTREAAGSLTSQFSQQVTNDSGPVAVERGKKSGKGDKDQYPSRGSGKRDLGEKKSNIMDTIEDIPTEVKYGTRHMNRTINYYRVIFPRRATLQHRLNHSKSDAIDDENGSSRLKRRDLPSSGTMERGSSHVKLYSPGDMTGVKYTGQVRGVTGLRSVGDPQKRALADAMRGAHVRSGAYSDMEYGTLVISNLLRSDAGNFHCRVDFRDAPTRHSQAHLTVIVPPSLLNIRGPAGLRVSGAVGPYSEGDTLYLWCSATGGIPTPIISWWLDGDLIDDVIDDTRGNVITNNLTIANLSRKNHLNSLTCRAFNSNLTKPLEATVTISMKLPPLTVQITGGDKEVMEGRLHKLTCISEGSTPPAELTWWARAEQLTHTTYQESSDGSSSSSVLNLLASASDDELRVSCRAVNRLLAPATALEDSVKITVLYPPRVNLRLSPLLNVSNIDENKDVFLDCVVKANPPANIIKWSHNGVPIVADPSKGIVQSSMSLVLQRVSRTSSGSYTCTASNRLGSATSNQLQLTVNFTPVCKGTSAKATLPRLPHAVTASDSSPDGSGDGGTKKDDSGVPRVYGTGVGVPVNISCSVEAHPKPHTFTWSLNATTQDQAAGGVNGGPGVGVRRNRGGSSSHPPGHRTDSSSSLLTYTPHTSHEFGTLLCWAENSVGRQSDPCVFQVVPASTPAPVHNCSVSPASPSSPNTLVLKCLPGWDGGLQQTFTLKVLQGKNSSSSSAGNNRGSAWNEDGTMDGGKRGHPEEWITGGTVRYIKDQRGGGRQAPIYPLEEGVLAVLTVHTSPHFTVSGLAAGQEYVLQVFSSNARGNSEPLLVNYMTPIDVAEGRLSSDSAYSPSSTSQSSGLIIMAIVLAVIAVFGSVLGVVAFVLVKKKRRQLHVTRDIQLEEDDQHVRSTTLVSVEDCQHSTSGEFESPVDERQHCIQQHPLQHAVHHHHHQHLQHSPQQQMPPPPPHTTRLNSPDYAAGPILSTSPMTVGGSSSSLRLPIISSSAAQSPVGSTPGGVSAGKYPCTRGSSTLQREGIVRTKSQEPSDPDILLYRLKSSDV